MKALLPAMARPLVEPHLPSDLEVAWFSAPEEADRLIADAEIAWIDMQDTRRMRETLSHACALEWFTTIFAGVDFLDLDAMRRHGVTVTNGAGVNANAVAEYAVMAVLVAAKRFDQVVHIAHSRQWTSTAPGTAELDGSRALVVGYGAIGARVGARLEALGVDVTGVTRSGREGTLGPSAWQSRLGEFDWVLLTAPYTGETRALIGVDELAAMKRTAWLLNFARGDMVDQDALLDALTSRRIGGAFLDVVTPEPLPPDHPLWTAPNAIHSMHLSGRSQSSMFPRAVRLFLDNLAAFRSDAPMRNRVDLEKGY